MSNFTFYRSPYFGLQILVFALNESMAVSIRVISILFCMSLKFVVIQSTAGNKFHSHRTAAEKGLCFAHTTTLKTTALQIPTMQQPFFAFPHAEITSAHLGSGHKVLLLLLQCFSNKIFLKLPSMKLTDIALNQILLLV